MAAGLKLGYNTGYWSAGPPAGVPRRSWRPTGSGSTRSGRPRPTARTASRRSPGGARQTENVRLGTGILQMSARQPTAAAMAAMTLDHLSGGRVILGIGVSGPQVVEGWYGMPFAKPLARTREYVAIMRDIWARQGPVTADGPHYPLPLPDGTGLGKPLKSSIHPLREEIPIFLAAEGPKNIALGAEICDGWMAMLLSPHHQEPYLEALAEGFAREGARRTRRRLRGRRDGADADLRRRRGRRRRAAPLLRPLLRRHGRQGQELPRQRPDPDGLRRHGRDGPGPLPRRARSRRPRRRSRSSSSTRCR